MNVEATLTNFQKLTRELPCDPHYEAASYQHGLPVIIWLDLHLTARSLNKHLLFTDHTIVDAIVTRHAVVVTFMKTTLYAKQVTVVTLRLAELDAGPEIYHCVIE